MVEPKLNTTPNKSTSVHPAPYTANVSRGTDHDPDADEHEASGNEGRSGESIEPLHRLRLDGLPSLEVEEVEAYIDAEGSNRDEKEARESPTDDELHEALLKALCGDELTSQSRVPQCI